MKRASPALARGTRPLDDSTKMSNAKKRAIERQREKKSWEIFRYMFIETGWFDFDRTKTLKAMKRLWERVPQEDLDRLSPVTVFAPSADILGELYPFSTPEGPEREGQFIYLSPLLEKKSQSEVDSTVAHEFAHAILGPQLPATASVKPSESPRRHADLPKEIAADKLVAKWGFKTAYQRKTKKQ